MDALQIQEGNRAGFDGITDGAILAALWPERCKALVAVTVT